jgi:SNF2 family DNA or RNA helicase
LSDQVNSNFIAEFNARIESGAIAFNFSKGGEIVNTSHFSKVFLNYLSGYSEVENDLKRESGRNFQVPIVPSAPTVDDLRAADYLNGHDFSIESLLSVHFSKNDSAKLYSFQRQGVEWLSSAKKRLLADDMGLGKTVQVIFAIKQLLEKGSFSRAVVIAPHTLVLNWLAEFHKWAPSVAATVLMPGKSTARNIWAKRLFHSHVIITSFDQLRENYSSMAPQCQLLVVDEAHRIRNSESGVSVAARSLNPDFFWMLSGTPVERDEKDFATLLSTLDKSRFSISDAKFGNTFLRLRAKPFMLRRTKAEVLNELPAITEITELVPLHPEQRASYISALKNNTANPLVRYGKLREICDIDPGTSKSSKIDRAIEILEQVRTQGESAVVFSFWKKPLEVLEKLLSKQFPGEVGLLTADLDILNRDKVVQKFKKNGGILLASAKIASEGLTLTEANHAIFLNRWWNPSANSQARDRIQRIGQNKATFVYSLVTADTIEARISALLSQKVVTINELIEILNKDKDSI